MANCLICGRKIGFFDERFKNIYNSCVCKECMTQAGISIYSEVSTERIARLNDEDLCTYLEKRKGIKDLFTTTNAVENFIEADEDHRLIKIESHIVAIDEIVGFDIVEDGMSVTGGGLGAAMAGGLLFGKTGALAGAMLGSKRTKNYCTSMSLIIILKNSYLENLTINFIDIEVNRYSAKYVAAQQTAKKCLKLLENVTGVPENAREMETEPVRKGYSAADEILRFKQLLDDGIITQEEFNFQKRKLLGMPK